MSIKTFTIFISLFAIVSYSQAAFLVPMDKTQQNHLRAYGLAYWILQQDIRVEWLLNYRDGSFITENLPEIKQKAAQLSVTIETADKSAIFKQMEEGNFKRVLLEKAPTVAVYAPPTNDPWDDAVRLALEYADIPYTRLWDKEVLAGQLENYDWLHLHHEDFTGQYGKFYAGYHHKLWYQLMVKEFEEAAKQAGFKSVAEHKSAVARYIKEYVNQGGFLFAMCSATDSLDIALAAEGIDIIPSEIDGTPVDAKCQQKLDFSKSLAFTNFTVETAAMVYEHSNIDVNSMRGDGGRRGFEDTELFEFAAKYDPVPSMLVQNHVKLIPGFMGQCTSFNPKCVKDHVIILGKVPTTGRVKYIHANFGKGTFTFLGGHDPEDPQHFVGDPQTDLSLHKNSPGYRLILNNVLFPAAEKIERKT